MKFLGLVNRGWLRVRAALRAGTLHWREYSAVEICFVANYLSNANRAEMSRQINLTSIRPSQLRSNCVAATASIFSRAFHSTILAQFSTNEVYP